MGDGRREQNEVQMGLQVVQKYCEVQRDIVGEDVRMVETYAVYEQHK